MRTGNRAQASLETTLAIIGALILFFGSLRIFVWLNQRILARQQSYETTRVVAGSSVPGRRWTEPSERLGIFR